MVKTLARCLVILAIPSTLWAASPAPTNFAVSPQSSTQLNLSWQSGNVSGFSIERMAQGDTAFRPVTMVGGGVRSYVDSGLQPATGYLYRIRSYKGNPGNASQWVVPPGYIFTAPAGPPACGAIISGSRTIFAQVSDDVGVVRVQFQLNGADFGPALTGSPWTTPWVTAGYPNGCYNVSGKAYDAAGNVGQSNIQVQVQN